MAGALLLQTKRENPKKYILLLPEAEPKTYQQAIKKRKGSRQKAR